MRLPLFLVAAIVLIVFAIIAGASSTGLCLGSAWPVWVGASLLAYYADLLFGFEYADGGWGRRDARSDQRQP
jgi:hypothetical protein